MRNPYIVGRSLTGKDHYGRHRLIEYLIHSQDQATWLVGTRRMGKTSLLRQLEWLLENDPESSLVPLFWDIQACENAGDLAYELFISIEDEYERFEALGVDIPSLEEMDAHRILRTLQRILSRQDKRLLLLIDEAEALINVARNDSQELARLRRSLQQGQHRTILTATKQLTLLNEMMQDWLTSPFLFGFNLVNLWSLDLDATKALILQDQNVQQVVVDESILEDVIVFTDRHPYLTQFLCHRIFEVDEKGVGRLRPVEPHDLQADHLLSGFLQIDYNHLSAMERSILLAVARAGVIDEMELLDKVEIASPARLEYFVYGMNKLGYLRRILGGWSVGNEFLRRWVLQNMDALARQTVSNVSDEDVVALLQEGRRFELEYLRKEYAGLQTRVADLLGQRSAYGEQVPLALSDDLQSARREMEQILAQIEALNDRDE